VKAELRAPAERAIATCTRRVGLRDVDSAGIVYLAAPFAWHEEMWTGLLYDSGHPASQQFADGVGSPVVSSSATYLAPIGTDFILACRLYADHIGHRSFGLRMDARVPDGSVGLTVATRHVWCRFRAGSLEPAPMPAWLRDLLSNGVGGSGG
jgi:acyl-CoA thioesterase FadM